jgi:hypothetical protein
VSEPLLYSTLAIIWLGSSIGGGALLALIAKRMHPAPAFHRLWLFYTALLAFAVAAFLAIALL